ncbi:uncharacterized protein LOC126676725 [Mercurialis annua]|uniref:uncharacterized protein LOC126676725 n=1 Tax=Mercurialis annua TaxID=3986 RepID=UPI00215E1EA9|nr:uncharacterized protein LOC126676725 [Mercurialis annua]
MSFAFILLDPCAICGRKIGKGASPHSPCTQKRKELAQNTADLKRIVNKVKRGKGKKSELAYYDELKDASADLKETVSGIPRAVIVDEYGSDDDNELDKLMEEAEKYLEMMNQLREKMRNK